MPRTIATDRLSLRSYHQDDASRLARLIASPEVQRWLPAVPHPYDLSDAQTFIDGAKDDEWKIAITLDGKLIGGIGIADQFGYWLAEPYWGKGYATEASRAVLDHHFAQTDNDVASGHLVGNDRSRNVLLMLGFQDTKTRLLHSNFEGKEISSQGMTLSADNWRNRA